MARRITEIRRDYCAAAFYEPLERQHGHPLENRTAGKASRAGMPARTSLSPTLQFGMSGTASPHVARSSGVNLAGHDS